MEEPDQNHFFPWVGGTNPNKGNHKHPQPPQNQPYIALLTIYDRTNNTAQKLCMAFIAIQPSGHFASSCFGAINVRDITITKIPQTIIVDNPYHINRLTQQMNFFVIVSWIRALLNDFQVTNLFCCTAVKPAIQLLQIKKVHLVSHNSACNFCRFLSSISLTCSIQAIFHLQDSKQIPEDRELFCFLFIQVL